MQDSLDSWLAGLDGLEQIHGTATLTTDPAGGRHVVRVDGRELSAPQVYLNVGGRASAPPIPGLDTVSAMSEVELLALERIEENQPDPKKWPSIR